MGGGNTSVSEVWTPYYVPWTYHVVSQSVQSCDPYHVWCRNVCYVDALLRGVKEILLGFIRRSEQKLCLGIFLSFDRGRACVMKWRKVDVDVFGACVEQILGCRVTK